VQEKITLVDGTYQIMRAVHVDAHTMSANGVLIGGARKVLNFLQDGRRFGRLVFVMDDKHSEWRKSIYPDYKKKDPEDELDPEIIKAKISTIKIMKILLPFLGIPVVRIEGNEGDDVLFRLGQAFTMSGKKVTAMSDDKDFFQLVNYGIDVYRPIKQEVINQETFKDKMGFNPKLFTIYRAMIGDKSDNINGIKHVGEKTATNIVNMLNSSTLDELFSFIDTFDFSTIRDGKRVGDNLKSGKEIIERNYKLMDLRYATLTIDQAVEALNKCEYNFDQRKVGELIGSLELSNNIAQWMFFKN